MLPKWICGRLAPLDFGSSFRDIPSFVFSQRCAGAFGLGEPRLERVLIRCSKEPPDRPQQAIETAKTDRPRMSLDAIGIPAGAPAIPSGGCQRLTRAPGSWRSRAGRPGMSVSGPLRAAALARAGEAAADTKLAEAT
jgi:hypothetical protein